MVKNPWMNPGSLSGWPHQSICILVASFTILFLQKARLCSPWQTGCNRTRASHTHNPSDVPSCTRPRKPWLVSRAALSEYSFHYEKTNTVKCKQLDWTLITHQLWYASLRWSLHSSRPPLCEIHWYLLHQREIKNLGKKFKLSEPFWAGYDALIWSSLWDMPPTEWPLVILEKAEDSRLNPAYAANAQESSHSQGLAGVSAPVIPNTRAPGRAIDFDPPTGSSTSTPARERSKCLPRFAGSTAHLQCFQTATFSEVKKLLRKWIP